MTVENTSKHIFQRRLFWLLLALLIVIADQVSKWAMIEAVFKPEYGQPSLGFLEWYKSTPEILPFISLPITSFFNLVMVWNTGVSFGMLGGEGGIGPIILMGVSGIITLFFLAWMMRVGDHLHGICFALIIGGAIGNMIDRARFGAVIDFLDFHAFGHHWPAFNVADMCVVMGVGLLIILSLVFDLLGKGSYLNSAPKKDVIEP